MPACGCLGTFTSKAATSCVSRPAELQPQTPSHNAVSATACAALFCPVQALSIEFEGPWTFVEGKPSKGFSLYAQLRELHLQRANIKTGRISEDAWYAMLHLFPASVLWHVHHLLPPCAARCANATGLMLWHRVAHAVKQRATW